MPSSEEVSNATYTAILTPPTGAYLNTTVTITATITGPAETATITLTLQNNVTNGSPASVIAEFPPPGWSLGPTITSVIPTFLMWQEAVHSNVPTPVSPVAITTVPATSITSAPVTAPSTETIPSGFTAATSVDAVAPSTSPTSILPPVPSNGYSAGEVAGSAVGSFVAGLLIACVLLLLFFRWRSKSKGHTAETENSSVSKVYGKTSIIGTGVAKAWDKSLPQPDSDKSIAQLASRTFDEIEMFVEEFYTNNKLAIHSSLAFSVELSQFESPHLRGSLTDLLQNANSPIVLIKHCIAYFLLQKIDPSRNDAQSLLPREYIIPKSLKVPRHEDRQALSQLRMLMANAYPLPTEDQHYLVQRDRVTEDAVREIEVAFQTWVRGDSSKRTSALKGIMVHVGELGIKLFSQPASFQWQWSQPGSRGVNGAIAGVGTEVVMLPGLDKTTDQKANELSAPICLVKPRYGTWAE